MNIDVFIGYKKELKVYCLLQKQTNKQTRDHCRELSRAKQVILNIVAF